MVFLIWLCDHELLRAEDAMEVLRACAARQKPIGRLAYEEGLLAKAEVLHIAQLQAGRPGQRFGEIALELGYLTEEGVGRLLELQARRAPRPEDMLRVLGYFDAEGLDAAHRAFLRAVDEGGVLAKPGPRMAIPTPVGPRAFA